MDLGFFGLTPNNAPQVRVGLFNMIHEIVFHGKGGYDWSTVYNMPIWLRKFTFTKIKSWYEEKNSTSSSNDSTRTNIDLSNPDKSKIPNQTKISPPTYITKASKK